MVRLKVTSDINSGVFYVFQFQNGSIKSTQTVDVSYIIFRFQFQNGSIKSGICPERADDFALFQFQNGSIKRAVVNGGVIFRS